MNRLPKSPLRFFWWLRAPLLWWVRSKVVPNEPLAELEIDPTKPVCYILPTRSISDLLVFETACREKKLPLPYLRPKALLGSGGAYIYLHRMGIIQTQREKELPTPLSKLVDRAYTNKDLEVQIVPVSIFWGRSPGKGEKSLFRLLFLDEERAGVLQKFFIVLAQGRNNLIHYGRPISLRTLVDEGEPAEETAKKLRRVLRVHFRRQRTATMGPAITDRSRIMEAILATKSVRKAIQDETAKTNSSLERVESKARHYADEIAANQKASIIRFFDVLLSRLFTKMFRGLQVVNADRIRALATDHEIVLLPCHRSHMDYLLLGYVLYSEGLMPPHTAAGINLNFWPVGPLLRRGGAFYLRRSFRGNRLYTTIFNEYLSYLLDKGYSINFFLEGGRSRTGKLLQPKTGMLSMVVQAFLRGTDRPIAVVPTYIGYERVMEVRSYLQELRGRSKRKESVSQLLKTRKMLSSNFGKVYVNFGNPILLDKFMDSQNVPWREAAAIEEKPKWLNSTVSALARKTLAAVNDHACVNPSALTALVILSTPQKAITIEDFTYVVDKFLLAIRRSPYSSGCFVEDGDGSFYISAAEQVGHLKRFVHPSGDVLFVDELDAPILGYYRNNILHIIAVPSLIASYFQHNDRVKREDLLSGCLELYTFLRAEFFLRWEGDQIREVFNHLVDLFLEIGLLRGEADGSLTRPDVTTKEFICLKILGRALGHTLERFAISAALLSAYAHRPAMARSEFEEQCRLMAQRISLLGGLNDPEFYDKTVFANFVDLAKSLGFLQVNDQGQLVIEPTVSSISSRSASFLSTDIRDSISRFGA